MPSASAKLEKQASFEAPEIIKQVLNVVEKKVRNLEKRKGKLDAYKADFSAGKELNEDQMNAIKKYDEVMGTLEFAKELQKNFVTISQDTVKAAKKQAKRDQVERHSQESQRMRELLVVQDVLNNMGLEHVRGCFLDGSHGALLLTEDNLTQLDELYKLISPSRDAEEGAPPYDDQLGQSSDHLVALLDGKNKEVLGSTYKDLKELILKIHACGFLSGNFALQKEGAEEEEATEEDEEEEVADNEEKGDYADGPEEDYGEADQTLCGGDSVPEMQAGPAGDGLGADHGLSASATVPAELTGGAAMDPYFTSYSENRPINEVISAVQGNFNFLQESQIDLDSPHMDPAVVAAHPMTPASSFNYTSQQDSIPSYPSQGKSGDELSQGTSPQVLQSTQFPPGSQVTQLQQQQQIALGQAEFNQAIPTQTFTNQNFVAIPNMQASNASTFANSAVFGQMETTLQPPLGHPNQPHGQPVAASVAGMVPPSEGVSVAAAGLAQLQQQQQQQQQLQQQQQQQQQQQLQQQQQVPPGVEPKKHLMNVNAAAFESMSFKPPNMGMPSSPTSDQPPAQLPPMPVALSLVANNHYNAVPPAAETQTPTTTRHSPSPEASDNGGWITAKSQSPGSYPHQTGQHSPAFQPVRGNFNNSRGGRGGRMSRGTSNGFSSRGSRGGTGMGNGNFNSRGGNNSYSNYRENQSNNYFQSNNSSYSRDNGYAGSGGNGNNYSNNYKPRGGGGVNNTNTNGNGGRGGNMRGSGGPRGAPARGGSQRGGGGGGSRGGVGYSNKGNPAQ